MSTDTVTAPDFRERFMGVLEGRALRPVPDVDFGYWDETIPAWHAQGLPSTVTNNVEAEEFFGLEGVERIPWAPVWWGFMPGFETELIEDRGATRILRDGEGNTVEVSTRGASIPRYIRYGIESREDWERVKAERLDYTREDRVGDVAAAARAAHEAGMPIRICGGSLYGHLRNWMGVENLSIALIEDREWVGEMMDHLMAMTIHLAAKSLPGAGVDLAWWWEDMCFNRGPLISPRMFAELMVPRYREITQELRRHGITVNLLDCDGRIFDLVPGWLEGGINCMFPIEAAHTDPLELRRQFPEAMLVGGVNKVQLAKGRDAIDREIARLRPLVEDGRFIPCIDHRVPPDVSLENYRYYLARKREVLLA